MLFTFRTILLITILFSLIIITGEKEDIKLREHLTAINITSIAAFLVTMIWL